MSGARPKSVVFHSSLPLPITPSSAASLTPTSPLTSESPLIPDSKAGIPLTPVTLLQLPAGAVAVPHVPSPFYGAVPAAIPRGPVTVLTSSIPASLSKAPVLKETKSELSIEGQDLSKITINGRVVEVPRELEDDCMKVANKFFAKGVNLFKGSHRARVGLAVDISRSMRNPNGFFTEKDGDFSDSPVQRLINQAMAMALVMDDNGEVEIFPFAGTVYLINKRDGTPAKPLILTKDNYKNAANILMRHIGIQKGTNWAGPIREARKYFFGDTGPRHEPLKSDMLPVYFGIITDGDHNDLNDNPINELIYASHCAMFVKLIAMRGARPAHEGEFPLLHLLDDHKNKQSYDVEKDGPIARQELPYVDACDKVIINRPSEFTVDMFLLEYLGWRIAIEGKLTTYVAGFKNPGEEGRIVKKPAPGSVTTVGKFSAPVKLTADGQKEAPKKKSMFCFGCGNAQD